MSEEKKIMISVNGISTEVEKSEIEQALETGKYEATVDGYRVFSTAKSEGEKSEFDIYNANLTEERYKAGKEKGEKDGVIQVMQAEGITLDDTKKTVTNLISEVKNKLKSEYEGKIKELSSKDTSGKLNELMSDKEKLQGQITEWEQKYNSLETKIKADEQQRNLNNMIISGLKEKIGDKEVLLNNDDLLLVFKNKYKPQVNEDGKIELFNGGQEPLKDDKLNLKSITDVADEFITPYMKKPEGGAGEGDTPGTKKGSYDAFVKEMAEAGKNEGSAEFQRELNKRIADKTVEI